MAAFRLFFASEHEAPFQVVLFHLFLRGQLFLEPFVPPPKDIHLLLGIFLRIEYPFLGHLLPPPPDRKGFTSPKERFLLLPSRGSHLERRPGTPNIFMGKQLLTRPKTSMLSHQWWSRLGYLPTLLPEDTAPPSLSVRGGGGCSEF